MKLYTIGHSNHNIEKFVSLLDENGIALLVDVRTAPYSRYNPQFNKENLQHVLSEHWIEYAYAGKFLGGRPSDPTCYKDHKLPEDGADYLHMVDYPEVMKHSWFIKGIDHLLDMSDERTTAIMCSEEDPAECHRHHLVSKFLLRDHPEVNVLHIRGDGTVFGAVSLRVSVDTPPAEQLTLF